MASAQVCRYNAGVRNRHKFHSVSLRTEHYDKVNEKIKETGCPRIQILEYLIDHFLDQVNEVNLNASSMRGRL